MKASDCHLNWGCSSVVERLVRNQKVASSSLVSSILFVFCGKNCAVCCLCRRSYTACRTWKMALGHDGLLHEVLGLLANLFPGCPSAQKAFANSGNPSLLQRTLALVNKPSLDLPTLQVLLPPQSSKSKLLLYIAEDTVACTLYSMSYYVCHTYASWLTQSLHMSAASCIPNLVYKV